VNVFNKKYIFIVFFLIFLSSLSPLIKAIINIIFLLSMFTGNMVYVFMAFSWINSSTMISPILFGYPTSTDTLIRLVATFLAFLICAIKYNKLKNSKNIFFLYQLIFCISIFLISIINSYNNMLFLSVLKLALFFCGSSFAILVFHVSKKSENFLPWMVAIFLNLIFLSFYILVFRSNDGLHNGVDYLFQGAFIHPNKLGLFLIPFFILFLNYFQMNNKKLNPYIIYFILGSVLYFVYLSGSRGALLSILLCMIIVFLISLFNKNYMSQIKRLSKKSFLILIVFLIISLPFFDIIINGFNEFYLKGIDSSVSSENGAFYLSRGWRILMSYQNFLNNPLLGIGFGIPTESFVGLNEHYRITYDPIFNLPISAPTEKSFFFIGVLEEVGIAGLLIFLVYYYKYSKLVIQNSKSIFIVMLYFYFFCSSMFEFYYFSIGSAAFQWIWVGFCSKYDSNHNLILKK
jgi:hypothetical protein